LKNPIGQKISLFDFSSQLFQKVLGDIKIGIDSYCYIFISGGKSKTFPSVSFARILLQLLITTATGKLRGNWMSTQDAHL
jgi:hypothetical protein